MTGQVPSDLTVLGIDDKPVAGLKDYYRRLWSLGRAGVQVPINVLRGIVPTRYLIKSIAPACGSRGPGRARWSQRPGA